MLLKHLLVKALKWDPCKPLWDPKIKGLLKRSTDHQNLQSQVYKWWQDYPCVNCYILYTFWKVPWELNLARSVVTDSEILSSQTQFQNSWRVRRHTFPEIKFYPRQCAHICSFVTAMINYSMWYRWLKHQLNSINDHMPVFKLFIVHDKWKQPYPLWAIRDTNDVQQSSSATECCSICTIRKYQI